MTEVLFRKIAVKALPGEIIAETDDIEEIRDIVAEMSAAMEPFERVDPEEVKAEELGTLILSIKVPLTKKFPKVDEKIIEDFVGKLFIEYKDKTQDEKAKIIQEFVDEVAEKYGAEMGKKKIMDNVLECILKAKKYWKDTHKEMIKILNDSTKSTDSYLSTATGILLIFLVVIIPFVLIAYAIGFIVAAVLIYLREKKKSKKDRKSLVGVLYEAKLSWIYVLIHTIRYFRKRSALKRSALKKIRKGS